jgi:KaiC/GvpD/RAD55 family RecA-like ATPase
MTEQMKKALAFLRHDLKLEEEASALYARQAAEMEEGWLKQIFLENVADEKEHAEIFKYAIERVEYSATNPTVSTGIAELDDILYGGVPEGYAVLLVSPPFDEKDLLAESFLLKGIDQNEVVLLLTTKIREMTAELVTEKPDHFYLFLCNPRADLILPDGPNIFKFQSPDLTQLNIKMESLLQDLSHRGRSSRRVVLEIVSDIILTHGAKTVRRWLRDLLTMLKTTKATILSTIDPGMHAGDEIKAVIDIFDGYINVEEKEVNGVPTKTLAIKRLYSKKYLKKELVLNQVNWTRRIR